MTFVIEPYVGAIPLRFGMSPEEVAAEIGPPTKLLPDPFGNRSESRQNLSLGYAGEDNTLNEAVFSPGTNLYFRGHDLFSTKAPIALLRQYDPEPQLWVGMVIFVQLGIRLSGFHDGDEPQRAIGVVKRGYWDEYVEDFKPFK